VEGRMEVAGRCRWSAGAGVSASMQSTLRAAYPLAQSPVSMLEWHRRIALSKRERCFGNLSGKCHLRHRTPAVLMHDVPRRRYGTRRTRALRSAM
jgi:hypothetical protein